MPKFTVKINGLKELRRAFQKAPSITKDQIQKAISLSVALVNRNTKMEAPVKTGRLRSSIRSRINPFHGIVEPTVDYAIYVHEGTKAHTIKPVRKQALYWKGADHPVKSVRHPGTKANPFMERGAEKSEPQIQDIFQRAINNSLRQIAR